MAFWLTHPPSPVQLRSRFELPWCSAIYWFNLFATRVRGLATWRCRSLWISAVHSSIHAWHCRPLAMPEGTIVVLAFVLSCVVNPLVCTRENRGLSVDSGRSRALNPARLDLGADNSFSYAMCVCSTDRPQSLRSRPRFQCLACSGPAAATPTLCIGLN